MFVICISIIVKEKEDYQFEMKCGDIAGVGERRRKE